MSGEVSRLHGGDWRDGVHPDGLGQTRTKSVVRTHPFRRTPSSFPDSSVSFVSARSPQPKGSIRPSFTPHPCLSFIKSPNPLVWRTRSQLPAARRVPPFLPFVSIPVLSASPHLASPQSNILFLWCLALVAGVVELISSVHILPPLTSTCRLTLVLVKFFLVHASISPN